MQSRENLIGIDVPVVHLERQPSDNLGLVHHDRLIRLRRGDVQLVYLSLSHSLGSGLFLLVLADFFEVPGRSFVSFGRDVTLGQVLRVNRAVGLAWVTSQVFLELLLDRDRSQPGCMGFGLKRGGLGLDIGRLIIFRFNPIQARSDGRRR